MNEPTTKLETRPDVRGFVDRVRARLADLNEEEREELVGGLEADLAELVSDGGSVSELGDPRAYADELRAAAGFDAGTRSPAPARRPVGQAFTGWLDALADTWRESMQAPALRGTWSVLVTLRPVWWVLRAWVALELFDYAFGNGRDGLDLVPTLSAPPMDLVLLGAAIVGSVAVGQGRLWPGSHAGSSPVSRVVLLALNVIAVLAVLFAVPQLPTQYDVVRAFDYGYGAAGPGPGAGLVSRGAYVENVFPYDAEGLPLTGVQLFDQDGRPLTVSHGAYDYRDGTMLYPWLNGDSRLYNVFPLPVRTQDGPGVPVQAWESDTPPVVPTPPQATVPTASLPTAAATPAGEPAQRPVEETREGVGPDSEKPRSR